MTVMSIFNNCRVFREDMPDKDIENALVDFTNMVSRILIILTHYLRLYYYFQTDLWAGLTFTRHKGCCATVPLGSCYRFPSFVPFPWLFIVTSSACVTRGSWTLLLGLRHVAGSHILGFPLQLIIIYFVPFSLTLSISLTCCPCRISRDMFFSFSKSLLLFRLANRCRDLASDR